jgi:hypothetical protein
MRNSLILLALLTTTLLAQSEPMPVSKSPAKLKPLHWLVGDWKGEGECMGQAYMEEFSAALVFEGHFIRVESKVYIGGQLVWQGTGFTGYDLTADCIAAYVFGMDGAIGHSTFKPGPTENVWLVNGETSGVSPFKKYTETLTCVSKDEFTLDMKCTEGVPNGSLSCRFQRIKPAAAPGRAPAPAKEDEPAKDPLPASPRNPAPANDLPTAQPAAALRAIIPARVRAR